MRVFKISLKEFKEKFPKYELSKKDEENSNLIYYKVELDNGKYVGVLKDAETQLIDFANLEEAKGASKNDPNFEYNLLSLIAPKFETRMVDSPISGETVDLEEKAREVDIELTRVRRMDIVSKIINVIGFIIVAGIVVIALFLKGNGK